MIPIVETIADVVRGVQGIQAATETVPGQIAESAIAIVYLQTWNTSVDTASNSRGNLQFIGPATVRVDIHYPKADIETAFRVLDDLVYAVNEALYHAFDPLNQSVTIPFKTSPTVNQSIVQGDYNGIPTLVRRFDITGNLMGAARR